MIIIQHTVGMRKAEIPTLTPDTCIFPSRQFPQTVLGYFLWK